MFAADEIRRAVQASPRAALPAVTAALWRAYSDGRVTEAEAEALSALIEARTATRSCDPRTVDAPQDRQSRPRTGVGSRPRSDASMERRRRWAASGRLPPGIAARFTLAEQAVLSLVAAETARRKDCRLAVGHVAAIVGVSETTVRNAIREARKLGLVTVEERQVTGFRNDTNIVRVVSPEWSAWLRLARKAPPPAAGAGGRPRDMHPSQARGGGFRSAKGTPTQVPNPEESGAAGTAQGLPGAGGRPRRERTSGIGAPSGGVRAMR